MTKKRGSGCAAVPARVSPNSVALSDCISKGNLAPLQIEFSFAGCPEQACTPLIELAFPARDDDRCQAIADDVRACAAHVHQFIDAENNGDTNRSQACGHKRI